jgi:cell division protein ZapA
MMCVRLWGQWADGGDLLMGKVQISINGRRYAIACDDGQEAQLEKLSRHFDEHVKRLGESVGQIGDQRLFLMAGLMIADEVNEMRSRLDRAEAELARARDAKGGGSPASARAAAEALNGAAARIEAMVEKLVTD